MYICIYVLVSFPFFFCDFFALHVRTRILSKSSFFLAKTIFSHSLQGFSISKCCKIHLKLLFGSTDTVKPMEGGDRSKQVIQSVFLLTAAWG